MKKFKLLPTVLMLVLCVGVLAVGVFAITPTKNTISGTITINATNTPLTIQLLADDNPTVIDQWTVRGGVNINLFDYFNEQNPFAFDTSTANELWEVPTRTLRFKVTNESQTTTLGAYYLTSELANNSVISSYNQLKDSNKKLVATAVTPSYTIIAPSQTADMFIEFNISTWDALTADFNFYLYVEEYTTGETNYEKTSGCVLVNGLEYDADYDDDSNAIYVPGIIVVEGIQSFSCNNRIDVGFLNLPSTIKNFGGFFESDIGGYIYLPKSLTNFSYAYGSPPCYITDLSAFLACEIDYSERMGDYDPYDGGCWVYMNGKTIEKIKPTDGELNIPSWVNVLNLNNDLVISAENLNNVKILNIPNSVTEIKGTLPDSLRQITLESGTNLSKVCNLPTPEIEHITEIFWTLTDDENAEAVETISAGNYLNGQTFYLQTIGEETTITYSLERYFDEMGAEPYGEWTFNSEDCNGFKGPDGVRNFNMYVPEFTFNTDGGWTVVNGGWAVSKQVRVGDDVPNAPTVSFETIDGGWYNVTGWENLQNQSPAEEIENLDEVYYAELETNVCTVRLLLGEDFYANYPAGTKDWVAKADCIDYHDWRYLTKVLLVGESYGELPVPTDVSFFDYEFYNFISWKDITSSTTVTKGGMITHGANLEQIPEEEEEY